MNGAFDAAVVGLAQGKENRDLFKIRIVGKVVHFCLEYSYIK